MPVAFEEEEARPALAVRPSAVAELLWVLLWLQHGPPHRQPPSMEAFLPFPEALVRRVEAFWAGDGCRVYSEVVVLGHATGHLFDLDPEQFFDDLDRGFPKLGDLQLRSETEPDREVILERLRRLQGDARLRRRYVQLLRDAWGLVRDGWHRQGRAAVAEGGRALGERLGQAADPVGAVPHLAKGGSALAGLVREEVRRGAAVVVPCYFGGWYFVLDLPDVFLVAAQVDPDWRQESRRKQMEPIAAQLRVLGDASRLAILAHVAEKPASVTELMSVLELAQPTVSAHVRVLREAGLLRAERRGARTDYVLDQLRIQELVETLTGALPGA